MTTQIAKQPQNIQPAKPRHDFIWNALTILVLVGIVAMAGCFISIYSDPQSGFNPFPPAASVPTTAVEATATPYFPPTWTPEVPEAAKEVTVEPAPTEPPAAPAPTAGAVVSATLPESAADGQGFSFELNNPPAMIASTMIHQDKGCQWAGLGGQVFDLQGRPLVNIGVRLEGELDGKAIEKTGLTGTALEYGAAGYEIFLGEGPVASEQTLTVQLLDAAGVPLSDPIAFDTSADCSKNLVLINFKQVK